MKRILGGGFGQSQFQHAVLNHKGPAHDLSADIESLGDDPLDVSGVLEEPFERAADIQASGIVLMFVLGPGGKLPRKQDHDENEEATH